jgi:hypothetical protein
MKSLSVHLMCTVLAGLALPAGAKLTVHEWGTFTVLQAPDGSTLTWYQGQNDVTPLPTFVTNKAFPLYFRGKGVADNTRYSIRMETPVLYFYPDAPMDVKVSVDFPGGTFTEAYPHGSPYVIELLTVQMERMQLDSLRKEAETEKAAGNSEKETAVAKKIEEILTAQKKRDSEKEGKKSGIFWRGSLVPPTPENLKEVPDASGPSGRHYAAARDVPDAWLFRRPAAEIAKQKTPEAERMVRSMLPHEAQTDHFIFYRGAGNDLSRLITVSTGDDKTFSLRNRSPDKVPVLFLLNVADGRSAWKRVSDLKPYSERLDPPPGTPNAGPFKLVIEGVQTVALPDTRVPLAESTAGLKAEMLAALEKEGLSKAEAAAMVATWDNLWFEEPGSRVLAVLPQPWVDAVLPLEITPKPEGMKRVFVERVEMISQARQKALVELLNKSGDDPAAAHGELQRLELGRFAAGALDRAVAVKLQQTEAQMRGRFAELNKQLPEKTPAPVVVGKAP